MCSSLTAANTNLRASIFEFKKPSPNPDLGKRPSNANQIFHVE